MRIGSHHSEETKQKMRQSHLGQFKGKNHYNWKGGTYISGGYAFVRQSSHPNATKKGYVRRSHLVAEKALGRILDIKKGEMTHHINEVSNDDRPENLLISLRGYHRSLHHKMRKLGVKIITRCPHKKTVAINEEGHAGVFCSDCSKQLEKEC